MHPLNIPIHKNFIGRTLEKNKLQKIATAGGASIIIMYGRRRIGKTELLEQTFRERNILKFEGIETLSSTEQLANAVQQLATYVEEPLLSKISLTNWSEFFQILAKYVQKGLWTIYFEELQWLANYESHFIAQLKYVWDNFFRHNERLIIILCGSSPSFMIEQVVHSRALYNRSQYEFNLGEFNLLEAQEFLKNRSPREVLDAYLSVGGIPEYLKWVNKDSSVFLSLCNNSFSQMGFFAQEYEKVFTSNLAKNKYYKEIIKILSTKSFATRASLLKSLKITSGGALSKILLDLEKTGFITRYYPFNLTENTMLMRYAISDNYLHFYYKFIHPIRKDIAGGGIQQ